MDKLISALLMKNKRVVVPGFGTFILEESGITFDRTLTFNDGALAEYLAGQEHTGYTEALARIGSYSARINETLDQHGSVVIEGIGRIEKTTDGIICHQPTDTAITEIPGTAGEKAGTGESIPAEHEETDFSLDESANIDSAAADIMMDLPQTSIPDTEISDTAFIIEPEQEISTLPGDHPSEAVSGKALITNESPVMTAEQPARPASPDKITLFLRIAIPAAVVILILLFSILYLFIGPSSKLSQQRARTGTVDEKQADSVVATLTPGNVNAEKEPVSKKTSEPEENKPLQPVLSAENNYYVVAGCFEEIRNAENYVILLKQHGYNARLVGVRKNLRVVSFDAFPGKQEALLYMNKIRQEFEPEAWVLYYHNH